MYVPESEAFQVLAWGNWLKPATPGPAMTISVCAMTMATPATRAITKNSDPLERRAAANQMFFASLPNFANTRAEGLVIAVVFSDGTQQQYRHTTLAGLQEMPNSYTPGTGVAGSSCTG
jgi:hypothetical protein